MKHYEKFDFTQTQASFVPALGMQIAEAECFHCGRVTRFPVQRTHTDWEKTAESYRLRLEEVLRDFDQMGRDLEVMHGENPAAQYAANRLRAMVLDILKKFERPDYEAGS